MHQSMADSPNQGVFLILTQVGDSDLIDDRDSG